MDEEKSNGRLVLRDSAGLEHGESDGCAISAAKLHLVGGNIRTRRLPRGHISLRGAKVLGGVARGTAETVSILDDGRRGVSSRSERNFVFHGGSKALRRHR